MVLTIKNFESQHVGPSVVETAPTNLVGVAGTLKATLTWTSATGESGVTWTEEKLVRKEGSAPAGSMDGTTVATITTKDTYATNGYEDTGLDSTKTYYYKVFAVYDNGTEKGSSDVNVTPTAPIFTGLCFTAEQAGSQVQLNRNGNPTAVNLEISTNGADWSDYTIGTAINLANVGDKVYMRNKSETDTRFSIANTDRYVFSMTGKIGASGDVTSLLNKNGTTTLSNYCFNYLFYNCANLTTAPTLPATSLANECYANMFNGCTSLTTAPSLPATTLATKCYQQMFASCISLATPPELPATTLAEGCCLNMFNGCSSLTTVPELLATTLATQCYQGMFALCTSLKLSTTQTGEYQIPYRIPTTGTGTTATNALYQMFKNTGGTFTGTPTINTTYYLSNGVTPPTPYPTESIAYKMVADSNGKLYVPVFGSSSSGSTASYAWNISVNDGVATRYNGATISTPITVATGLTPGSEHKILITPVSASYGWARCFAFNSLSGVANLLTEVLYDGSYMGYADSATSTGKGFKRSQFAGCVNLKSYVETPLPSGVTTIGDNFAYEQFRGCTGLINIELQATNPSITKYYFRRQMFYQAGTSSTPMIVTINGNNIETGDTNSLGLTNANVAQIKVDASLVTEYQNSSSWSNITDSKFVAL